MISRACGASLLGAAAALLLAACGSPETAAPPAAGDDATAPPATSPGIQAPEAPTEPEVREEEPTDGTSEAPPPAEAPVANSESAPRTARNDSRTTGQAPSSGSAASAEAQPSPPATASGDSPSIAPMPGTVTRQTELKAEPSVAAPTLSTLAANTQVTITERQGGWLRVVSGEQRGWVRLLHVSSQPTARTAGAREELEAAARIATGRAGSGNIAVTTGIRGLDEQQLRDAKANEEELKKLEAFGVSAQDAQAHASRRGLERRQIPYPPAPQSR